MDNYLIEYSKRANEIIKKYDNYKQMVKDGTVNIPEVNKCLSEYFSISTFLIEEYERKSLEYELFKESFDQWYSEKYVEIRERFNTIDLASGKWLSKHEIDSYVRQKYKNEYSEYKYKLLVLNREVATLRRICDTFKKMDNIFSTLSNNQRAEMKAYSLENRMNNNEETTIRRKRS